MTAKQAVVAGVFTLALAGAAGFGLASKQFAAATVRDCSKNSINYTNNNGGCGAANPAEYIKDLRDNKPSDIRKIAANFHKDFKLKSDDYNRFKDTARQGKAYKNGKVVVDGQTVMTNAWSIGRHQKSYSWKHNISGNTYHASHSRDVFLSDGLDVMVMFDKNGEAEFAVLNACGNPMGGKKVQVKAKCEKLSKKEIGLNKYEFTTNVSHSSNASVDKVVYYAGGKKIGESGNKGSKFKITHTFTKSTEVTAKVHFNVPGKQTKVVTDTDCKKKITFKAPFAECSKLVATVRNDEMTRYRFTVKTKQGNGATLKDADFSVWKVSSPADKTTVTGVSQKDDNGNIYREFEFDADGEERIIEATVNFNIADGIKSDKCKAKVTPKEEPKCPIPGKEHLSPEDEGCKEDEQPEPEEPKEEEPEVLAKELPKTGAGSVLGIFASATGAGAAAHRLITRRFSK